MNLSRPPIMIVDDDIHNVHLLKAQLEAAGYETLSALSGQDCLDQIQARLPDLILLDIMMPDIDGFEVARRLKADERTRNIPVVMVTALEDRGSRMRALEAGAEEFLNKPVDHAELLMRVKNLLRLKEYQDLLSHQNDILEQTVRERTAALAASEEKFRSATETARDAFIIVDGEGGIVREWNAAAEAIFGYRHEEAIGRGIHDLITAPHLREAARRGMEHFAGTGEGASIGQTLELTALHKDGHEFPVEISLSAMQINGKWHATGIARDITGRIEQQAGIERLNRSLHASLTGIVTAMAATLEMRDPYTAGHQRRVSELAAAIARELGLDEGRVECMHLAGLVHDLGKISVPAEILVKPARLSAIEFRLIQEHPEAGYQILKNIEFPWPIADTVRQHHERLDGSGYPHGLKGAEILLESRIMAVADVVEAISSHRPYRPALGIEAGLAEIARGRGAIYDADSVDASLRLFLEKGFAFG